MALPLCDLLVSFAFFSIPATVVFVLRRRPDLPFRGVWKMFSVFLFLCGLSHFFDAWTLWEPITTPEAITKTVAALCALIVVSLLVRTIPRVLALPNSDEREREKIAIEQRAAVAVSASEARLRRAVALAPMPLVVFDHHGKVLQLSAGWTRFSGYTQEDIPDMDAWTRVAYGDHAPQMRDYIQTLFHSHETVHEGEFTIRAKDGARRVWDFFSTCLEGEGKGEGVVLATAFDVTERWHDRRALERAFEDLRRSNRDLEQFAFIASHDLREPLRMVRIYVQLLARHFEPSLTEESAQWVQYVTEGARRMDELVRDLSAYSRAGRSAAAPEWFESSEAVEAALAATEAECLVAKATVRVGKMPRIFGVRSEVVQVFQNLLGNAFKFRSAETPPVIIVGCIASGVGWRFSIRDNGIGIREEYRDKIFTLFQRLHGAQDYPGTGIGLALCKRIVEAHGGRISFESREGKGTTFHFTVADQSGVAPARWESSRESMASFQPLA